MTPVHQNYDRLRAVRKGGFSLVELIVAAALTVVLATLMISVTSGMLGSWNRSRGKLTSANQARLALEQIASDLNGALYRPDGNAWLAATIQPAGDLTAHGWSVSPIKPDNVVVNAADITDCSFGRGGVWLRFFTPETDYLRQYDDDGNPVIDPVTGEEIILPNTAPCATAYQIVRQRIGTTSGQFRYLLFRSRVRSTVRDPTLEDAGAPNAFGQDVGTFEVGHQLDPTSANAYQVSNATLSKNPGTITLPHRDNAIVMNVVDFGVRLLAQDGSILFPTAGDPEYLAVDSPGAFPRSVLIFMRILTDEGADLIENLEAGRIQGDWWDIALANSQTYVRRIELNGRGL